MCVCVCVCVCAFPRVLTLKPKPEIYQNRERKFVRQSNDATHCPLLLHMRNACAMRLVYLPGAPAANEMPGSRRPREGDKKRKRVINNGAACRGQLQSLYLPRTLRPANAPSPSLYFGRLKLSVRQKWMSVSCHCHRSFFSHAPPKTLNLMHPVAIWETTIASRQHKTAANIPAHTHTHQHPLGSWLLVFARTVQM